MTDTRSAATAAYFSTALAKTLTYEGGWADNPKDPGGATNRGITLATYRLYKKGATKRDLLLITPAEVSQIYRVGYWDNVSGDKLPPGVSAVVFDYAVNSGVGRAMQAYRKALVTYPNDPARQVAHICDSRLAFLQGLSTWGTFGNGWKRRVIDLRAFGIDLATKASAVVESKVAPAAPSGTSQVTVGRGQSITGAAISLTPIVAHTAGLPLWAVGLATVAALGVILYFCLRKTSHDLQP